MPLHKLMDEVGRDLDARVNGGEATPGSAEDFEEKLKTLREALCEDFEKNIKLKCRKSAAIKHQSKEF